MEANAADAGCISAETLAQLIQDSFDQYLEDTCIQPDQAVAQELQDLCAHVCECFEAALDPAAADVDDAAPLPCVDPEVVQLQEELKALAERVSACRQHVPAAIAAAIDAELAALRPSVASATAALSPVSPADAAGSSGAAPAAELQAMLAATLDKLPALRARVEQAVQRLGRVLSAVESDSSRPEPKTVEKVIANRQLATPL